MQEKQMVKATIDKEAIYVPLIICLYIALTNLKGFFAVPFVLFSLVYLLARPSKYGIGILVINIMYLGYSYINIYPAAGMSNYAYSHYSYLFFAITVFREHCATNGMRFRIKANWGKTVVGIFFVYVAIRRFNVSITEFLYIVFLMLCVFAISKTLSNIDNRRILGFQFLIIVLSVWVYFVLQRGVYLENDGRFPGVRDANNFALYSNLCLILVNCYCKQIKTQYRIIINIILALGIIATISVSGFATMAVIFLFLLPKHSRKGVMWTLAVGVLILLASIVILVIPPQIFANMGGSIGRIANIIQLIQLGDMNHATTGRFDFWIYYLERFQYMDFNLRLMGDLHLTSQIQSFLGYASHNTYIDLLLTYGYIGIGLFVAGVILRLVDHVRNKDTGFMLASLVMIVNIIFRSMSGMGLYLFLFI